LNSSRLGLSGPHLLIVIEANTTGSKDCCACLKRIAESHEPRDVALMEHLMPIIGPGSDLGIEERAIAFGKRLTEFREHFGPAQGKM
jgi:hypothetical protein